MPLVSPLLEVKLGESAPQRLVETNFWMHTALYWKSKIADLYNITVTLRRQFYTLRWSDIQYVLPLAPADDKKTEKVLLTGSPHVRIIALRHPPDLRLSASERSRQQNYWGHQAAPSTSVADAQLPTGLSRGHKRADLKPLAWCGYSWRPPPGLILLPWADIKTTAMKRCSKHLEIVRNHEGQTFFFLIRAAQCIMMTVMQVCLHVAGDGLYIVMSFT